MKYHSNLPWCTGRPPNGGESAPKWTVWGRWYRKLVTNCRNDKSTVTRGAQALFDGPHPAYWWPHFENHPSIVNLNKCSQTLHGGLLVLLQRKSRGRVINIDFIIFLFNWTTKDTHYAIVYWTMIIILYLIWMFLICH